MKSKHDKFRRKLHFNKMLNTHRIINKNGTKEESQSNIRNRIKQNYHIKYSTLHCTYIFFGYILNEN